MKKQSFTYFEDHQIEGVLKQNPELIDLVTYDNRSFVVVYLERVKAYTVWEQTGSLRPTYRAPNMDVFERIVERIVRSLP